MNDNIYSVAEAAEKLKTNPPAIRKLIKNGELKAYKKLRKWYILHSEILEYLRSNP